MDSGLVRCAISTVMDEEELQMKTAHLDKLRETGKLVLERAGDGEANLTAFDSFSEQLTSSINGSFDPKAQQQQRERSCGYLFM